LFPGTSVDDNKENKVTAVVEKKRTAFPGLCIPDQLTEDTSKVREAVQKTCCTVYISCTVSKGKQMILQQTNIRQ